MADQSVDAAASTSNKRKKLTDEERKARKREYRKANKEKIAAYNRQYRDANKEKIAEANRQYYKDNKETIAEASRLWREDNREHVNQWAREWAHANKEKCSAAKSRYREKNRDKVNVYNRQYSRLRKQIDPAFHLISNIRCCTNNVLRGKFIAGSGVRDMGCTGQQACDHLESLFDEHMTWDNWGTYWEVDHIFPLSKANHNDRIEFLAVVNWRNLQPLEKGENKRKGDTVTPEAQKLFDDLKTQLLKENAA